MAMKLQYALVAVLLAGVGCNAQANDSTATLGAGGLVFTKSDSIVMEKEDLSISEDKVRVAYIFRNTSAHDIKTRVAFPVPEFSDNPDIDMNGFGSRLNNPMNFWVTVDGVRKKFETEVKKRADGANHLYKITHYWTQTFPAHQPLAVVHEYDPGTGGEASYTMSRSDIKGYCIEPSLQADIKRATDPQHSKNVSSGRVDYILTTGANWKGPIGKFRLTVKKRGINDLVSFCGTGTKKTDPRTFVMEKANFTPKNDLQVLFLHPSVFNN